MYHFIRRGLVWRWDQSAVIPSERQSRGRLSTRAGHRQSCPFARCAVTATDEAPLARMRVLVVHNRFRSENPSGEDRVVDQEHGALSRAGHEVTRFERHSDDIAAYSAYQKARVPAQMLWSVNAASELAGVVRVSRPDVVHVHSVFPLISPSVLRTCQSLRVPTVITVHAYDLVCCGGSLFRTGVECRECLGRRLPLPGVKHGCYRKSRVATLPVAAAMVAHRRIWRNVPDAYIFLSHAQHHELLSLGLPPGRCFVKANFTAPTRRRENSQHHLVLYLGRLDEGKGVRVLMRAWDRYMAMPGRRALRLAIAGSGPLDREVRAWAHHRRSVEMHGLVARDRCTELLARAAAAVVPSEWPEPFGLVAIEAMAAGVPPIATTQGALPELITDQVDGLLYPPGDEASLATLLQRIQDAPEWCTKLGVAAIETYERRFTQAVNLPQLEDIYRFAIGHPRWLEGRGPPTMADHRE
jgi:glycosyltransferase involved in cell wall biosynthesis